MIKFSDENLKHVTLHSELNMLYLEVKYYDGSLDCQMDAGLYLNKSDAIKIGKYFSLREEDLST